MATLPLRERNLGGDSHRRNLAGMASIDRNLKNKEGKQRFFLKKGHRVSQRNITVGELEPLIRRIGTTMFQSKVVLFA